MDRQGQVTLTIEHNLSGRDLESSTPCVGSCTTSSGRVAPNMSSISTNSYHRQSLHSAKSFRLWIFTPVVLRLRVSRPPRRPSPSSCTPRSHSVLVNLVKRNGLTDAFLVIATGDPILNPTWSPTGVFTEDSSTAENASRPPKQSANVTNALTDASPKLLVNSASHFQTTSFDYSLLTPFFLTLYHQD